MDEENKTSAADKQNIISVIAHELAHHWFGDYVTLDWWSDAWLNEGFATYFQSHIPDLVSIKINVIFTKKSSIETHSEAQNQSVFRLWIRSQVELTCIPCSLKFLYFFALTQYSISRGDFCLRIDNHYLTFVCIDIYGYHSNLLNSYCQEFPLLLC